MRGISPIVAVVLLIAIAVVGSVSIYFFVGGIATKEPSTAPPTAIAATAIDPQNGVVMVQNLGTETIPAQLLKVAGSQSNTKGCWLSSPIQPGEQGICHTTGFEGTETIYGSGLGSAVVKAKAGDTNPYFICMTAADSTSLTADEQALYDHLVNDDGYNVTVFNIGDVNAGTVDYSGCDVVIYTYGVHTEAQ